MDSIKTPEQVIKALASDWLEAGWKYQDIAIMTGYKYQTIANFISGKKTYFTAKQARKLEPLGYRMEFLMFGQGCLRKDDDVDSLDGNNQAILSDEFKLNFFMQSFQNIAKIYQDTLLMLLYDKFRDAFVSADSHVVAQCFAEIQQYIAVAMMAHGWTYDENGGMIKLKQEGPEEDLALEGYSRRDDDE